jgi:hypothetical protein
MGGDVLLLLVSGASSWSMGSVYSLLSFGAVGFLSFWVLSRHRYIIPLMYTVY